MATLKKVLELLDSIGATMLNNAHNENKYSMHYDESIQQDIMLPNTDGFITLHDCFFSSKKFYHVQISEKHILYFSTLAQIEEWAATENYNRAIARAKAKRAYEEKVQAAKDAADRRAASENKSIYVIQDGKDVFVVDLEETTEHENCTTLYIAHGKSRFGFDDAEPPLTESIEETNDDIAQYLEQDHKSDNQATYEEHFYEREYEDAIGSETLPDPIIICEYEYPGYFNPSHCLLELYKRHDGKYVAVCTELKTNPGTSVTNRAEIIATQLVAHLAVSSTLSSPDELVFVERYNHLSYNGNVDRPTLAIVSFTWENYKASKPEWEYINTLEEVILDEPPIPPDVLSRLEIDENGYTGHRETSADAIRQGGTMQEIQQAGIDGLTHERAATILADIIEAHENGEPLDLVEVLLLTQVQRWLSAQVKLDDSYDDDSYDEEASSKVTPIEWESSQRLAESRLQDYYNGQTVLDDDGTPLL